MTSDEPHFLSASSGGGEPGSSGRPARTIELEADEVDIEVSPGQDPGEGETPSSGDAAPAPDADESGPEKSAGEEKPPAAGKGKGNGKPPPPPQRTAPGDLRSFVTHLAAGLAGGVIGVIGAGVGLDKLPLSQLSGGAAQQGPDPAIVRRLDALEAKTATPAGVPEDVENRIRALEDKPAPAPSVPDDVAARLDKLENTLATLSASAGEEGAGGLAQSAALTARIDDLSSGLGARADALKGDIEELKTALRDRPQGADPDIADKLAGLERKIVELAARPAAGAETGSGASGESGAALALAFESLRRSVERGGGFAAQLTALRKAAPEGVDLTKLAANAETGAPSASALLRDLPPLLREARAATAKSGDNSFLDRLVSNAQSVVRVRRIGPQEGAGAVAVLSRMEAAVTAGDFAGVVREAGPLDGPALATVEPWLEMARTRQQIDAALEALEGQLMARLDAGQRQGQ